MKHIFSTESIFIESEIVNIVAAGGVNVNGNSVMTSDLFKEYTLKGVWSADNGATISGLTPGTNDATGPERVHLYFNNQLCFVLIHAFQISTITGGPPNSLIFTPSASPFPPLVPNLYSYALITNAGGTDENCIALVSPTGVITLQEQFAGSITSPFALNFDVFVMSVKQ